MTPRSTRPTGKSRWVLLFLAATVTIWATSFSSATASAATTTGAETRVRASTQEFTVGVAATDHITAGQQLEKVLAGPKIVVATGVAANSGSRIALNQAAGNAARDAISAAHPGSLIEQSFTTTAGVRRLDVLTRGLVGIESKVGRTSLTGATRSQIAKDSLLLQNGDVNGIQWVFSRSGVTGQIGPTGPLADALSKAGIPWSLAP
jgi:hypothetical protein